MKTRTNAEIVKSPPLLSYVLTAYNCEAYIEDSVRCAFAQTYSPLEIVLSDDCSTDGTFEIMQKMAREYEGPHRVVLNRNEVNLGITRHMNKAYLELAGGEIVVAAHGDDVSLPDRAKVLADYLQNNQTCMQVANSALVCDASMKPLHALIQRGFQVPSIRTYQFGSGAHVSVGFSAFRRKVMTFFGSLGDKCPTEDDPIGFRAILLGEIAVLPNVLTHYRKHGGSNSNPENFAQFPLDEIHNQMLRDMQLCLDRGILTEEACRLEEDRLCRAKDMRKMYREYFSKRTISTFYRYITYPDFSMRRRLSALKEHIIYLMGIHE